MLIFFEKSKDIWHKCLNRESSENFCMPGEKFARVQTRDFKRDGWSHVKMLVVKRCCLYILTLLIWWLAGWNYRHHEQQPPAAAVA